MAHGDGGWSRAILIRRLASEVYRRRTQPSLQDPRFAIQEVTRVAFTARSRRCGRSRRRSGSGPGHGHRSTAMMWRAATIWRRSSSARVTQRHPSTPALHTTSCTRRTCRRRERQLDATSVGRRNGRLFAELARGGVTRMFADVEFAARSNPAARRVVDEQNMRGRRVERPHVDAEPTWSGGRIVRACPFEQVARLTRDEERFANLLQHVAGIVRQRT